MTYKVKFIPNTIYTPFELEVNSEKEAEIELRKYFEKKWGDKNLQIDGDEVFINPQDEYCGYIGTYYCYSESNK